MPELIEIRRDRASPVTMSGFGLRFGLQKGGTDACFCTP